MPLALKKSFKWIQLALLALTLAGMLFLLGRDFNSQALQALWQQSSTGILLLAALLSASGLLLKAERLRQLTALFGLPHSFGYCFKTQVLAISFAMLTPGRAGEFSKAFLLTRKYPGQWAAATITMVIERLMDLLALGIASAVFAALVLKDSELPILSLSLLLLLCLLGFCIGLMLLFRFSKRLQNLIPPLLLVRWQQWRAAPLETCLRFAPSLCLTLIAWVADGAFQWLILKAVGLSGPLLLIIGINAIVAIASVLSLLPIGLGTVDLSAHFLYTTVIALSKEEVVFLVAAGRVLGLGTLLLLALLTIIGDPRLFQNLRSHRAQTPAALSDEALADDGLADEARP